MVGYRAVLPEALSWVAPDLNDQPWWLGDGVNQATGRDLEHLLEWSGNLNQQGRWRFVERGRRPDNAWQLQFSAWLNAGG